MIRRNWIAFAVGLLIGALLILYAPDLVGAQAPALITATYESDRVIVSTSAPGCLYLIGNGKPSAWIGCDGSPYILPLAGVDYLYTPAGRIAVLVGYDGIERARLALSRALYLPLVVR